MTSQLPSPLTREIVNDALLTAIYDSVGLSPRELRTNLVLPLHLLYAFIHQEENKIHEENRAEYYFKNLR